MTEDVLESPESLLKISLETAEVPCKGKSLEKWKERDCSDWSYLPLVVGSDWRGMIGDW